MVEQELATPAADPKQSPAIHPSHANGVEAVTFGEPKNGHPQFGGLGVRSATRNRLGDGVLTADVVMRKSGRNGSDAGVTDPAKDRESPAGMGASSVVHTARASARFGSEATFEGSAP